MEKIHWLPLKGQGFKNPHRQRRVEQGPKDYLDPDRAESREDYCLSPPQMRSKFGGKEEKKEIRCQEPEKFKGKGVEYQKAEG